MFSVTKPSFSCFWWHSLFLAIFRFNNRLLSAKPTDQFSLNLGLGKRLAQKAGHAGFWVSQDANQLKTYNYSKNRAQDTIKALNLLTILKD